MKHVTSESADHLAQNPFPELHRPFNITDSDSDDDVRDGRPRSSRSPSGSSSSAAAAKGKKQPPVPVDSQATHHDVRLYKANVEKTEVEVAEGAAERGNSSGEATPSDVANGSSKVNGELNGELGGELGGLREVTLYCISLRGHG